jgi:antirestriction protein
MSENNTFRVYVSTFGLYNSGRLTGFWCDAIDAPETIQDFTDALQAKGVTLTAGFWESVGEELNCFDTESSPLSGECSPIDAKAAAEILAAVDDDQILAFAAVCDDQNVVDVSEMERIANNFDEMFAGYFDDVEDYAREYADSSGMLSDVDATIQTYFDYASFGRDMELGGDITLLTDSDGKTFVVNNNV